MPTLLLTYFGPFSGTPSNPTGQVAQRVAQLLAGSAPGLSVQVRELPVEFAASSRALAEILDEVQPQIAIALGVAVGRDKVSLERVAINMDSARIPDNAGDQRTDTPIQLDGPTAYFSTLPTRAIFERLTADGLPLELSYSAGTFVCNHVFYELMHQTGGFIPAGFIHIPLSDSDLLKAKGQLSSPCAEAGGLEGKTAPTLALDLMAQILEGCIVLTLETLTQPGA
ncbi:pyroglutamyl-peptidase I [Rothia sp. CCM 9416]|uniref:pyroglutamyl-peptidase I family protein n=1 Tax=Rothia sp. CCM 9416 TaxID=3402655 RepID=UPI003AE70D4C